VNLILSLKNSVTKDKRKYSGREGRMVQERKKK